MNEIICIGIDTSKSVFQVLGVDARGEVVLRRRIRRVDLLTFFSKLPGTLIGLEACGGSHY